MKNIAVFCSANKLSEKYVKPAEEFARLIAENGYHLVWGGARSGLMEVVATAVKNGGGGLIGVSIPVFSEFVWEDADELIITETLRERKAVMLERSDACVALVGGIGTLDEITEIIELKKQKHHSKPIIILNTEHFYDGLMNLLQKMKDDGFIDQDLGELVYLADEPQEAIDEINKLLK